jgi:hypothetical protein
MANQDLKYCATDKEIYDLLMSAKQRVNESAMHDMAKARGIFYSPLESRESLASQISLLTHDYAALGEVLGQSENRNRAERVTSVTLNAKLTSEEIKAVVASFQEESIGDQKVVAHHEGDDKYVMQVQYSEIDYAKTRLLQRRQREADIRFEIEPDRTTIRLPANPKARAIVEELRGKLIAKKAEEIPRELIEITDLSPEARTQFFTNLITSLEGYTLVDVSNVKVQSGYKPPEPENAVDDDNAAEVENAAEEETAEAEEEMLSVVENVALHGQSLLASSEYQNLRKKGFYITSLTWVSAQTTIPFNQIEFDAGFEEPKEGKEFRYNVRGVYRRNPKGILTKSLRPLTDAHKQVIYPVLEHTAHTVLAALREKEKVNVKEPNGPKEKPQ